MSDSDQAFEAAIIDVDSAAAVVVLPLPPRLANGAMTEIYFSPKQSGKCAIKQRHSCDDSMEKE